MRRNFSYGCEEMSWEWKNGVNGEKRKKFKLP
ncbi:hypothetical protein A2U01_0092255, partial [Trifolium medium]|nr:hypothetical protein [Trifolium medium]